MQRKISDSVVVITGASSGIGHATALELAGRGARVVLAARRADALTEVALACERAGGSALTVPTDVTDELRVYALARRAIEAFGRIDVWINNAGVVAYGKFDDLPSDVFRRVIETNFFGCVHGARAALPHFKSQGCGTLINISSVLGKLALPYSSAYVASKFAVAGLSESLRMELSHHPRIHVCTVLPATIDTPLFEHAANYSGRVARPMPPVYAPEEVARTIVRTIRHPRSEVTMGNGRSIIAARRLFAGLAERVIVKKTESEQFQDRQIDPTHGNLFESQPALNALHGGWRSGDAIRSIRRKAILAGTVAAAGITAACIVRAKRR